MVGKKKRKIANGNNYPGTLNVLFHGLWAYEVHQDEIVVRTPPEDDHRIAAGSWLQPTDLTQGKDYRLKGVRAESPSHFDRAFFDRDVNAIFENRRFLERSDVFCTIHLPLPTRVSSLRPIEFNKPPYTGEDADLITTRQIAIVQVFTYAADPSSAGLVENGNRANSIQPEASPTPKIQNLYLFAQPARRVPPNHFEEAFAKLAAFYNLQITPVNSIPSAPSDPNLAGLTWRDEVGLNERAFSRLALVPAGATSGSSCDPFVIDNRQAAPSTTQAMMSKAHSKTNSKPGSYGRRKR